MEQPQPEAEAIGRGEKRDTRGRKARPQELVDSLKAVEKETRNKVNELMRQVKQLKEVCEKKKKSINEQYKKPKQPDHDEIDYKKKYDELMATLGLTGKA